jgi:hypothetical protein
LLTVRCNIEGLKNEEFLREREREREKGEGEAAWEESGMCIYREVTEVVYNV